MWPAPGTITHVAVGRRVREPVRRLDRDHRVRVAGDDESGTPSDATTARSSGRSRSASTIAISSSALAGGPLACPDRRGALGPDLLDHLLPRGPPLGRVRPRVRAREHDRLHAVRLLPCHRKRAAAAHRRADDDKRAVELVQERRGPAVHRAAAAVERWVRSSRAPRARAAARPTSPSRSGNACEEDDPHRASAATTSTSARDRRAARRARRAARAAPGTATDRTRAGRAGGSARARRRSRPVCSDRRQRPRFRSKNERQCPSRSSA